MFISLRAGALACFFGSLFLCLLFPHTFPLFFLNPLVTDHLCYVVGSGEDSILYVCLTVENPARNTPAIQGYKDRTMGRIPLVGDFDVSGF